MNLKHFFRRHWLPVLLVVLFVLYAAGQTQESEVNSFARSTGGAEPVFLESAMVDFSDEFAVEQKIITTGTLSLHVQDVRESVEEIQTVVEGMEGSVLNSDVNQGTSSYSAYMTVRVPSADFGRAMDALKD